MVEMRVSAGDDEREGWGLCVGCAGSRFLLVQEDGVDVAFEVIDCDERQVLGEGERLGIGDADEECSGKTGAGGDGDGIEIGEGEVGLCKRGTDDGDDGAEVLAAGQLGDDTAVAGMGGDLRRDDGGECVASARNDGRRGLVAGGFNAEDEAAGDHFFSVAGCGYWGLLGARIE